MGHCHADVGRVGIETRRESFIVTVADDGPPGPSLEDSMGERMEVYYYDLPDLIAALERLLEPEYPHSAVARVTSQRLAYPSMPDYLNAMRKAVAAFAMAEYDDVAFTDGNCNWTITRDEAAAWEVEQT